MTRENRNRSNEVRRPTISAVAVQKEMHRPYATNSMDDSGNNEG